ncbi:Mitochondrial [Dorcoceras hygrometricum]|uniref:Mitochondrial n=1 Tax=Dorcoceras hygrometricum TaxID=472368 RepID=A0A2Z7AEU9_9LAMI|nr:Mitochondrial [Dorcoceras hygrometricum]
MLKFLSKVRIEFNALDPRIASCMEFLAQYNARPKSPTQVARYRPSAAPTITVTFVNGVEETFNGTSPAPKKIRNLILETEQLFREAGEK